MQSSEFKEYATRLKLSKLAIEYIREARAGPPARRVDSFGKRNTVWRYSSDKMGFAVSLESSEEHALAVQLEHDPDVLEYWEQPPQEALSIVDGRGTHRRVTYVPDFLVLRSNRAEVVQVKPVEACERLAVDQPRRWSWDGAAACDKSALARFSEIGLPHIVYVSAQAHKIRVENYTLLLRIRHADVDLLQMRKLIRALSSINADEVLSVRQLMREADIPSVTTVAQLIDRGELFTDLDQWRLCVPDECFVSKSKLTIEGHTLALNALGIARQPAAELSSLEMREAYRRLLALRGVGDQTPSRRSLRRWRARLRKSAGDPLGLAPLHRRKGNRLWRLSADEQQLLDESLRKHYLHRLSTSALAAHAQYLLDHREALSDGTLPKSSRPVSYATYLKHSKRLRPEDVAGSRSGKRAAAAAAPPVATALKHLSPARAFERAHADHYLCDIHVLVADSRKRRTLRPQLTAMRDEATGALLAISLSFNAPSCRSILGLIRDCARRHARLPETIIVDNGPEFHSEYFEVGLARLGVSIQRRPPGNPRSGGTIEAWFHSLKAFLSAQSGNTNNDHRGRAATTEHKGPSHAAWQLYDAYRAIERFAFDVFNASASANDMDSRATKSEVALNAFPESGVRVNFNDEFLARTAIPIKGRFKVNMARGIKHNERWFSHPRLFNMPQSTTGVEVWEEPWDCNTIYALVDGTLVTCRHGSAAAADLCTDFQSALESIRRIECTSVRSELKRDAALESAALVRRLAKETSKKSGTGPKAPARPKTKSVNPTEVRTLPVEYWP